MDNKEYKNKVLKLLRQDGNGACVDCGAKNPRWVSLYYGTFMCLDCAGMHRSFGVYLDCVRSTGLDALDKAAYLPLKHGGNRRFGEFLAGSGCADCTVEDRYRMEAVIKYSKALIAEINEKTGLGLPHAEGARKSCQAYEEEASEPSAQRSSRTRASHGAAYTAQSSPGGLHHYSVQGGRSTSSVGSRLPEWKANLTQSAANLKSKTLFYGTKIGSAVASHAKTVVSASTEFISRQLKKDRPEPESKVTVAQQQRKAASRKDWS